MSGFGALFRRFVMFGFQVKVLISRIISGSVLERFVNKVGNVDCRGIFISMLVADCPKRQ